MAAGTKENVVGGGTIIMDCGSNFLVVVDVPFKSNAPLPIPIPDQVVTVGVAMGYQVLWSSHLVILSSILIHVCNFHVILHFRGGICNFDIMILLFTCISKRKEIKNKRK